MIDISSRKILNTEISPGVYLCPYTGKSVELKNAILLGPILPSVSGSYVCHPDAVQERKKSVEYFNESEANCNTCKNLERVQHDKKKGGFLLGKCLKKVTEHIYPMKGEVFMFHPEDPMGMKCWEGRK